VLNRQARYTSSALEISMHYSLLVRRGQRIGELNAGVAEFFCAEAGGAQLAAECPARHQLIDDEACVRGLHEVEYHRDAWMTEA
jgi:hypothetical protein